MSRTILVFFGPPGSGKGTQTNMLASILKLPAISTGALLRDESKAKTSLARHIKKYMMRGEMVEIPLLDKVLKKRLARKDAQKGFLLDGYPRNIHQLKHFLSLLKKDDKILFITIGLSDLQIMKRLLARGRADDKVSIIKRRVKDYHSWNDPLQKLARQSGVDIKIHGNQAIEKVQKDIRTKLKPYVPKIN